MERCGTCRFFGGEFDDEPSGECRRRAPVMVGTSEHAQPAHPVVETNHWCGEWRERNDSPLDDRPAHGDTPPSTRPNTYDGSSDRDAVEGPNEGEVWPT